LKPTLLLALFSASAFAFSGVAAEAADAPLPFTPPAGWPNALAAGAPLMPQAKLTLKGPKTGDTVSQSVVIFTKTPTTGALEDFANQGRLGLTMMQGSVTGQRAGTICGEPARFTTARTAIGPRPMLIEQSFVVDHGAGYATTYVRDGAAAADPKIEATIAGLCPAQIDSGKTSELPPGWTATIGSTLNMLGMWMNPNAPGSMINLLSMPYEGKTLAAFSPSSFQNLGASNPNSPAFTVDGVTDGTLCNLPARFFTSRVVMSGVTMTMKQEAVLANGMLYILSYGRIGTQAEDPTGVAAMKTLCPRT